MQVPFVKFKTWTLIWRSVSAKAARGGADAASVPGQVRL